MTASGQPDTDELLRLAGQGDASATEMLLGRHRSRLRQMIDVRIDSRLAARLDPSDVVQDALIEAADQLPRYLHERPVPFYPWLRQIAWDCLQRLHARHVQARKRSVEREEQPSPMLSDRSVASLARRLVTSASSPSRQLLRKELQQRVRTALEQLGEHDREVLVMRFLEQLTPAEIAAVLGLREGTVKVRQLRALSRLRKLLDEDIGRNEP